MNERFRTLYSNHRDLEKALNSHMHEGWLVVHIQKANSFHYEWVITVDTEPPTNPLS